MDEYLLDIVIDYNSNEDYQNTLLSLFSMEEFNDTFIVEKIKKIFNSIKEIETFRTEMELAAATIGTDDLEMGFILLFSYDHLPKLHKMLSSHFGNHSK